ncbi:unnamed protein product, partial [Rotaria magnacalcarata]
MCNLRIYICTFVLFLMINFTNGIPQNLKSMIAARSGWSNINSMNQVRMFHTASLLIDGKLLVAGGSDNAG